MKTLLKLAALPVLFCSISAQAAYVASDAFVSFFEISTTGTAEFNFTGLDYFIADSLVNDASPLLLSEHYEDSLDGGTFASSVNADSEAYAGAYPYSIAVADTSGMAYASSYSEYGFELSGLGTVTLSFDVALSALIEAPDGIEYADVGVSVFDSFGGFDSFSGTFFDPAYAGGPDIYVTDFGTLELIYNVDGFDAGTFSMETFAVADTGVEAVPVPAAAWFMFSALAGLVTLARRRK